MVVDPKSKDDTDDGEHRHRQHQLAGHDNRLLNHVDIAQRARNHGTGSKAFEIARRKLQGLTIDRAADVAGNPRGQARSEVRAGHRTARGHSGSAQHEQAVAQDVLGRSRCDAHVDHICKHGGNQQRSRVVNQQNKKGEGNEPFMRFEETHKRFHIYPSFVIEFLPGLLL